MKKEWNVKTVSLGGAIIGAAVALAVGLVVGINWNNIISGWGPYLGVSSSNSDINWSELSSLYNEVNTYYDGYINKDDLLEGAKKGMVEAIGDDYTSYMNQQEATEYKQALEGTELGGGVGVEIGKREDYVKVIRTLPDNPARKAGVLAGDIIYAIDDEEVWKLDAEQISTKLRGDVGTSVKLTVVRGSEKRDFELTRETINNVSADISYEDDTAIISIYRFASNTGDLVASFASEVKDRGIKKIVLDLRNNGGGYVNAAVKTASLWLDGDLVMIQKSKNSNDEKTYAKRGMAEFADIKTVVLVNGSTASASEILAGALKDHGKATIIGETTYGKGVMQQMLNVNNNAILKVTIAHWYTPNDVSINGSGIKPDIEVERTYEQINKSEDPQLEKALSELNN